MNSDFLRLDPADPRSKFTAQLIQKLRTKLLDLTGRNPLLNYRHSDKARAQVRAVNEIPSVVYAQLCDGKELSFRELNEPPDEPEDERSDEFQMALEAARLEDVEYLNGIKKLEGDDPENPAFLRLERSLKDRVRQKLDFSPRVTLANTSVADYARKQGINPSYDLPLANEQQTEANTKNEIQTLLFPDRMEARLSALREGARRALEEQGINTLFGAYGFLEWYEAPQAERPLYAPVLLQPLEIDRVSYRGKWRYFVRATGEDTTHNITLAERLKQDFGLDLPRFGEDEDLEAYFVAVADVIAKQKDWRLRRFLTFGLFSFGRLVMWQDLDPNRWPTKADPSTNPIVTSLLAGGGAGQNVHAEDYPVDDPPWTDQLPPLILNADSSQMSAILDAIASKNIAIKGPPGTGKSQTITNLIAAAMAKGKRVLFLAEKLAALDVVKSRLDHAGLGPFVLELHSTKAKKKEVLDNLAARLAQQNKLRAPSQIAQERWELERLKRNLTRYAAVLNSSFAQTGKTIQEILWAAQQIKKVNFPSNVDSVFLDHAAHLTIKDLERGQAVLKAFENTCNQVSTKWGKPTNHPWSWVTTVLSPFEQEDLLRVMHGWRDEILRLECIANDPTYCAFNLSSVPATHAQLQAVRNLIVNLPSPPESFNAGLLALVHDSDQGQQVLTYINLCKQRDSLEQRCSAVVSLRTALHRHKDITELSKLAYSLKLGGRKLCELDETRRQLDALQREWNAVQRSCEEINSISQIGLCETYHDLELMLAALTLVTTTPRSILVRRRPVLAKEETKEILRWATDYKTELVAKRSVLGRQFNLDGVIEPSQLRRNAFILRQTNLIGRLGRKYRQAKKSWQDLTLAPRKIASATMADELDYLADHVEKVNSFNKHPELVELLGAGGIETNFEVLLQTSEFLTTAHRLTVAPGTLRMKVKALLCNDNLENLDQLIGLSTTVIPVLRQGLEIFADRKASTISELGREANDYAQSATRLANALLEFDFLSTITFDSLAQLATDLADLQAIQAEIAGYSTIDQAIRKLGLDPIFDANLIEATISFTEILTAALPPELHVVRKSLFSEATQENFRGLKALSESIASAIQSEALAREAVFRLSGTPKDSFRGEGSQIAFPDLRALIDAALDSSDALRDWNDFIRAKMDVVNEGAWPIIQVFDGAPPINLAEAYASVFWRSLAKKAFDDHPDLKKFSGVSQERARDQFRRVDQRALKLNQQELAANLCHIDPLVGVDSGPKSEWTELALIRYQTQLQRPRIAIRDLLRRAGRTVQALKPCWMMSPISVAQFLDPETVDFDIVIIDEASQVKPEEAIGAIARGRQVVVVGDPMQLPPTAFFERVDAFDDEDDQDIDEESILDMALAAFYPYRHLTWHYRSRHESLIAYSNQEFYDNQLIVFPSPSHDGDLGVKYQAVNGVYQGRGGNPEEVRIVAEAAINFMRTYANWSLGVAAINLQQAELLRLEIDRLLVRDTQAQEYVERWKTTLEPFFVKNLENVQGDERDCIMISTVYGPNQKGQVMQRFGPINQKTGHRRLNVLFTRAKYRVEVFTSLTSSQVLQDEQSSSGVKALKGYLEYAATGRLESGAKTDKPPDSDFEVYVAEALKSKGYEVVPQVGVAGFFIDIGVKHPSFGHGYIAGVECDGATYHSAKSARDRDALRQEILEALGWKLYRIWSIDWFNNPRGELEKLTNFLEASHTP